MVSQATSTTEKAADLNSVGKSCNMTLYLVFRVLNIYLEMSLLLKFTYNFGYFDSNGNSLSKSGEFEINNEREVAKYTDPATGLSTEKGLSADGYIGFQFLPTNITKYGMSGNVDGEIYFMFTESSSDRIQNSGSTVPVGEYSAEVSIVLESL